MDIEKISKLLRKCEVFSELSDKEIRSIAKLCNIEKFNVGDSIYSQGGVGKKLYILAEGEVTLERTIDIGDQRKAKIPVFTFRATPSRRIMGGWFALLGETSDMIFLPPLFPTGLFLSISSHHKLITHMKPKQPFFVTAQ